MTLASRYSAQHREDEPRPEFTLDTGVSLRLALLGEHRGTTASRGGTLDTGVSRRLALLGETPWDDHVPRASRSTRGCLA